MSKRVPKEPQERRWAVDSDKGADAVYFACFVEGKRVEVHKVTAASARELAKKLMSHADRATAE